MWSTIIPEVMTIAVWVLTFLSIRAGAGPGYLQNYAVMSIDTSALHQNNTDVYDVYKIFISTVCAGNYANSSPDSPLVNYTCTQPSSYSKFNPYSDSVVHPSTALNSPGHFPGAIQNNFLDYNLQLHVAWVFYVLSLVWTGLAMLFGLVAFLHGALGSFMVTFTSSANTCLFISSVIVSVVQQQAVQFINNAGNGDILASSTGGLLALTWTAFALGSVSSLAWLGAGLVSGVYRHGN